MSALKSSTCFNVLDLSSIYPTDAPSPLSPATATTTAAVVVATTSSSTMSVTHSALDVNANMEISKETILAFIEGRIADLITLTVQGSSLPLSLLTDQVHAVITHIIQELKSSSTSKSHEISEFRKVSNGSISSVVSSASTLAAAVEDSYDIQSTAGCDVQSTSESTTALTRNLQVESGISTITASEPTVPRLEWESNVRISLEKLTDIVVLGEKIKSLALREPYGPRGKNALLYEDSDPSSIWRWEALR